MKKWRLIIAFFLVVNISASYNADAQCSICTKTSMQQGEKPARGMNSGIIYLMLTPFAVVAFIGYRWWKTGRPEN
jgi:hypothetical protein